MVWKPGRSHPPEAMTLSVPLAARLTKAAVSAVEAKSMSPEAAATAIGAAESKKWSFTSRPSALK